MTNVKITEDILLKELFELFPESREVLKNHGYDRIISLDIEEVVIDKLSLRGLLRLTCSDNEEGWVNLTKEIQNLYNKKLEDM